MSTWDNETIIALKTEQLISFLNLKLLNGHLTLPRQPVIKEQATGQVFDS